MTDERPVLSSVALGPQHLLRLPDEHASGIEGSAGRANRRRVDDASERLVLRFDHAVFQATANPVRVDLSTTADEVWEALDIVAHHDDLRPGRIELGMAESEQVDDHVHFDQSYGLSRPGLGSVAEKMAAGASILIHGIEFHLPELWSIVADLETVGGRSSSASVIVFGPRSAYVETSERTNDVLLAAIDAEFLLEAGSSQSTVIEPGSGIVVPAGHATTVTPLVTPERSEVLLRFDLPAADPWFDLVNAASAARFHPLLRADLPTLIDAPIESYAGSLCQADQWRAEVASVFTAQAFNHVAAYERACIAPRPDLQRGLLTALTGTNPHEGLVRSPSNGGVMLAEYEGDWRLVIDGMILEPPGGGGVAMAVAEHLDGRPFDVTVLLDCLAGSGLGEFVIDRLVADLIRLELIEVLG